MLLREREHYEHVDTILYIYSTYLVKHQQHQQCNKRLQWQYKKSWLHSCSHAKSDEGKCGFFFILIRSHYCTREAFHGVHFFLWFSYVHIKVKRKKSNFKILTQRSLQINWFVYEFPCSFVNTREHYIIVTDPANTSKNEQSEDLTNSIC